MDDLLMECVAKGDQAAFEKLVQRHEQRLIGWLNKQRMRDCEDLSQETFLRVWQHAARYVPGNFAGWLFRIARNLVIDSKRRSKHMVLVNMDESGEKDGLGWFALDHLDPADVAQDRDLAEVIRECLEEIPRDQADVVETYAEGYSLEEISRMGDSCHSTVKSRMRLGRVKIRHSLATRTLGAWMSRVVAGGLE